MSRRHVVMLLALAGLWGASFMFIKIAVRELEPGTLVLGRVALAAATLLGIVAVRPGLVSAWRAVRGAAGALLVAGVVNSALPFWLISWAEQSIDSGLTAILQACAPLFAALLAWRFSHGERVAGGRLVGVLIGFAGVALLVGLPGGAGDPLAAAAVVGSGLCYAAAALYIGARLSGVPPLLISAGTMVTATLVSAPVGLAGLPGDVPGWRTVAAMLALGIAGTGLAYILYYSLITGAGASRAILITYLVPAVAVAYGAAFLGEAVTLVAVGGLALVLAGVALGSGAVRLAERRRLASSG